MATNRQPGAKGQGNGGMDPVLICVLAVMVYIMVILVWMKFHTEMSTAYGYWRWVTNGLAWLIGRFIANVPVVIKPFHDALEYFRVVDPSTVSFETIRNTSKPVNIALLLLVTGPLAYRAIRVSLKTNPINHKNFAKPKDFTVESFMKAQEDVYPHLKLYSALNMLKQGVNEGRLRMADHAKQFIMRNNLVADEATIDKIVFDKEKAKAVYRAQLGPYWMGLDKLSPVELCLFAAFVPKAAATDTNMTDGDYVKALETSKKLVASYWNVFKPDEEGNVPSAKVFLQNLQASPEYAEARQIAEAYLDHGPVAVLIQRHAYVRTVLYELLSMARGTGTFPSSEFRWCKLVDRELWFCMNTTGRKVAVPEVAGFRAHYLYEMKAKQAVEKPMIDTAVDALEAAFLKLNFSEDEWKTVLEMRAKAEAEKAKAAAESSSSTTKPAAQAEGDQ